MNKKFVAVALAVIIMASAIGYLAYKGTFSASSETSPTSAPTATASPSPTRVATPTTKLSPTASPVTTATPATTASPTPQPTSTPQPVTLTIFAASSLTNVIANMTQRSEEHT